MQRLVSRVLVVAVAALLVLTTHPTTASARPAQPRGDAPTPTTTTVTMTSTSPYKVHIVITVAAETGTPTGDLRVLTDGGDPLTMHLYTNPTVLNWQFFAGRHALKATFLPGTGAFAGSSGSDTVDVVGRARITETFPATVDPGDRASGRVVVDVLAPPAAVDPDSTTRARGKVEISEDGDVVRRATLAGGRAEVTLPRLDKGKHRLVIEYAGDGFTRPATKAFTVKQE